MANFVDREDFYLYKRPDMVEQTKRRLIEIAEMGMEEVGIAEFGIRGVMSGLYIERVWNLSDEGWDDYMKWVSSFKNKKL